MENETRLDKIKKVIEENIDNGDHYLKFGIFDTRNTVGDHMETLTVIDGVTIDICDDYGYFEVFGLTDEEWSELYKFYNEIAF